MPDITKQPYKNIIELYTKLKVLDPVKIAVENVNVHNKNEYMLNFKDWKLNQTGGTPEDQINNITIKLNGNKFIFNSYHMDYMAFYSLLTPDEQSCIVIEINKTKRIAHIESLQFSNECFDKCATEKNGSMLLKVCLKLINTIKDKYKLKYVWLQDSSHKYCEKVNDYIKLDLFYMLLHGTSWHNYLLKKVFNKKFRNSKSNDLELYGKYGFVPFKQGREMTDVIVKSKYEENQKIVRETLIEDTSIEKILISTIKQNKLKFDIDIFKKTMEKYKKMTINDFFKILIKDFNKMCELFYYSYEEIAYKCGIHDLHNNLYWIQL